MQNFVVYKSSAGSGKTFTLVKEYLRLALYDEKKLATSYKKILAVTFTNKAAAEMKNRVIDSLNQLSNGTKSFIGSILCDEMKISAEELKRRASLVLNYILHHYSDFSIGTIDSFTHKIVKTFAHDLKLPVNFTVELDTKNFYEKVVAQLLNKIGEDEYVSKLLKEFVLAKTESNTSWDPEKQIIEFSKLLQKENSEIYIDQLKQYSASELEGFRKQFSDFMHHYKETLKTGALPVIELIEKNNLSDSDFIYKKQGPQRFFYKCVSYAVGVDEAQGSRLKTAVEQDKWADKSNPIAISAVNKIAGQLKEHALRLIEFIEVNYVYYSLCELLSKQMYPLMLLKKIEEISQEQKQEDRLVFITEFNQRIFNIINNEPTPFIYERLGERYKHYLLDEFQDTSSLQWQNILPLIDNSLSNGWFNLLVGDGKQSIYRWRNANVKQFAQLPLIDNPLNNPIIDERAKTLKVNFKEKLLNTNYRSLKVIVEFNNSAFNYLNDSLLSDIGKSIYKSQNQLTRHNNENADSGYVSIHFGKVEKENANNFTLKKVKAYIESALESGFSYRDICVLCRTNVHGSEVAAYLLQQKIPVVSSDSLLLKKNTEVNTLISFLNYLNNNTDIISAANVINYLFQSGQINEQMRHSHLEKLSNGVSLIDILKQLDIHFSESELSFANLFDCCIQIIQALHLNKQSHHYMRFFLDEINEFLILKNQNISFFFDWWASRSNKASLIVPDSMDAVKIMTIHACKGLEFPVVIIPYCNWPIYKSTDTWVNIHDDRVKLPVGVITLSKKAAESGFLSELETEREEQLLDNLNLLYVAFTRAVERLHIISSSSNSIKTQGVDDWLEKYIQLNSNSIKDGFFEAGKLSNKQSTQHGKNLTTCPLKALDFDTKSNVIQIKPAYLNTTKEAEQAKQQGILIHWLLSKIKNIDDIESAIEGGLIEGLFSRADAEILKQKLNLIVLHPKLSPYFKSDLNCKTEAELITETGNILRPDRIILSKDKTTLIDYKTGKKNNGVYFKQLQEYENALKSLGFYNVEKLLVYIDDMDIVKVN